MNMQESLVSIVDEILFINGTHNSQLSNLLLDLKASDIRELCSVRLLNHLLLSGTNVIQFLRPSTSSFCNGYVKISPWSLTVLFAERKGIVFPSIRRRVTSMRSSAKVTAIFANYFGNTTRRITVSVTPSVTPMNSRTPSKV